jgi:hypothetical protein
MFVLFLATTITSVGGLALVISSFVRTGSDSAFNVAAFCLTIGPLIFFSYVIVGLCIEFVSANRKPESARVRIPQSFDAAAACTGNVKLGKWVPEGLRRERKGPLNRVTGRAVSLSR